MIHPGTELRRVTNEDGYGVFATEPIPRGTVTWMRDELDLFVPPTRLAKMPPAWKALVERFSFVDPNGDHVVCWDFGRYMNHSCEPTTVCIGTICDIAARDIGVGEQLTCEYSIHNLDDDVGCRCGAPSCRGIIRAADLPEIARQIDEKVRLLIPHVANRPQPLKSFFRPEEWGRLDDVVSGKRPVPSVLDNRPK